MSRKDPGLCGPCQGQSRRWSSSAVRATWTRPFSLRWPVMHRTTTGLGTFVMALKPGDGSAREQAACCQRVLGGCANLAAEYATKRYRSNVVNWGMLPFIVEGLADYNIQPGDQLWIPGVRTLLEGDGEMLPGYPHPEGQGNCCDPSASQHDPRRTGYCIGRLPDQLLQYGKLNQLKTSILRDGRFLAQYGAETDAAGKG